MRGIHRSPVNTPHKGQWHLNKRLSKTSFDWWFETPSRSLWRQCNAYPLCDDSNHSCLNYRSWVIIRLINSSAPGQNGRHFADNIFKCNDPALNLIMASRRRGDTSLFEPTLTHIFGTRWRIVIFSATNNASAALAIVILNQHTCHTTPSWEYPLYNKDSKIHVAHMRPTWVFSAPDGPRVGPVNLVIREVCIRCTNIHIDMCNAIQFIQCVTISVYVQEHAIATKLNLAIHFPLLHISCRA